MRPLALLVLAEFLLLAALAAVWLTRGEAAPSAAAAQLPPDRATPASVGDARVAAGDAVPAAESERRSALLAMHDVDAGDPLGILVSGCIRSVDGTPVDGRVGFRRDGAWRSGSSAAPGVYAATGLLPGEWTVSCTAEGFANYEATCTLDSRAFQHVDIELQPSYVVRVKIASASGERILEDRRFRMSAPQVVATEEPLAGDLPPTENSGPGRFGLGDWRSFDMGSQEHAKMREQGYCGELHLRQKPPVHVALLLRTVVLQRQVVQPGQKEVVFLLEAADLMGKLGTVKLRLLDGVTGEPLRGTMLRLSTAQGGGAGAQVGDDGNVVIEQVLPGLNTLSVHHKDREHLNRLVRVPAGGVVDLGEIRLAAALDITGTVVDADGKPAGGASVQWTDLDGRTFPQPLVERRSTTVDADGKFTINGCGAHRYVLTARLRDGRGGFATVDATRGAPLPMTIAVAATTRVTLRASFPETVGYVVTVFAGDRSPIAVAMLGAGYRQPWIQLPPGSYTVEIHEMQTDRLVRSAPLQVGSEPFAMDVP